MTKSSLTQNQEEVTEGNVFISLSGRNWVGFSADGQFIKLLVNSAIDWSEEMAGSLIMNIEDEALCNYFSEQLDKRYGEVVD